MAKSLNAQLQTHESTVRGFERCLSVVISSISQYGISMGFQVGRPNKVLNNVSTTPGPVEVSGSVSA